MRPSQWYQCPYRGQKTYFIPTSLTHSIHPSITLLLSNLPLCTLTSYYPPTDCFLKENVPKNHQGQSWALF